MGLFPEKFNNILISGFLLINIPFIGASNVFYIDGEGYDTTPKQEPVREAVSRQITENSKLPPENTDKLDIWIEKLEKYDWNVEIAKEVIKEESHFNKKAYNPEWHKRIDGTWCQGSYGPFQIACLHYDGPIKDLYDPELNIKIAYSIYKNQGVDEWGVCTDGKVDCSDW